MWAPLATGAFHGWSLAVAFLLVGLAAALWLTGALLAGRLEWRRTPLDLPVLLLLILVGVQLAIGHGSLVRWALAPAAPVGDVAAEFPTPFLLLGTVSRRHTWLAGLTFAGYAAVYFLVVQTVRTRRQLGLLVRTLLVFGGVLAFMGLVEYAARHTWLFVWREHRAIGRVSGPFVNPDTFAAWLAMLIALGLGFLVSRGSDRRSGPSWRKLLSVRELREQATRRYLPMLAILVASMALMFTLSRGGLVNVVAALLVLTVLLRAVGRARRSLAVTAVLLIAVVAYGGWIGFGPLMARLADIPEGSLWRVEQYLASVPILREFPVLGVGLGAYRDVYARYQPATHRPDAFTFAYAHNDLLQLVVELGLVGLPLVLFFGWRLLGDLVGAHLLGRGACPVDGGAGEEAMRSDRYSVGVAIGALAGIAGLLAHSALDFSARTPAVGLLAATLLGLATVALHTRLAPGNEQLLSGTRTLALRRPLAAAGLGVLTLGALAGWTWAWTHTARMQTAELALLGAPSRDRVARAEVLLALDRGSPQALLVRGSERAAEAIRTWESPPVPGVDRAQRARELLAQARADLRAGLAVAPTDARMHLDLGWVEAADAVVQGRGGLEGMAAALTHGARAVTSAADTPSYYAGMARLAYSVPELGLRAAREAVRREPALLGEMIDLYRPLGLTEPEWLAMVPATTVDRLDLALVLEARRLRADALGVYRAAVAVAGPREVSVGRWALAEALGRAGLDNEATDVLRAALTADADNPELERALGAALARRNDPEALEHLRQAVSLMERRAKAVERRPFAITDKRLAKLVERLANDLDRPARYRRALAGYLTERRLWDQALPEWRDLVAAAPRDAESRFGLGLAREATGAIDEAIEDYRAAVSLDPRVPRYHKRLAERLWQGEQYFQAINEWRTVKDLDPHDRASRAALARAYERVGQPADAAHEYRELLAMDPNQPDVARALARLEGGPPPRSR